MKEYKTLEDKIFEDYVATFTHLKNDGTIETLYSEKYVDEIESENEKLQQRIDKAIDFLHNNTMIGHCKEHYELLEILGDKE